MITLTALNNAEVNITDRLVAAMAAGEMVELVGGRWAVDRPLVFAPGAGLVGKHRPVLRIASTRPSTALKLSESCRLQDLVIDADKASKLYHYAYVVDMDGPGSISEGVEIINPLSEAYRVFGDRNRILKGSIKNGDRSAIFLKRGTGVVIDDMEFDGMAHFGVHVDEGANRGSLTNLRTSQSGLELIAVLEDTWGFRIENNHAEGCGDNGISVGGWGHTVVGNHTLRNDHNGICLFGSHNTCSGNIVEGNNQRRLRETWPTFAGISVSPGFGSLGRSNSIAGNWSGDLQDAPTQWGAVLLQRNTHLPWASGQVIPGYNPYRHAGNRVYKAVFPGNSTTCGGVAPSHTSGSWTDNAGLVWDYVAGDGSHLHASGNMVSGNIAFRNTTRTFHNDSPQAQAPGGQV